MKTIIKREDEQFNYANRYGMAEYYDFQNGVEIKDETITEWINQIIEHCIKEGRNADTYNIASGNTIVWGERVQETDNPDEDYIEIRVAKGYEEFTFDVDKLEI